MKLNQEEREAVDRIVFSEDFKVFLYAIDSMIEQQAARALNGGYRPDHSIAYETHIHEGMTRLKQGIEGLKGKTK
jgi:hypothetical protein